MLGLLIIVQYRYGFSNFLSVLSITKSRPEDSTEDVTSLAEFANNGLFVGVLAINASAEG